MMMVKLLSSQSSLLSLWLPFVIICNLGILCELKSPCSKIDKQILLSFKHGLTGPSGVLSTWSNKKDCCTWKGIQCNTNGRVTNISLPCSTNDTVYGINKNKTHCLAGDVNLSLFEQLEFLNYLDLSNNDLRKVMHSLDYQNLSLVYTNSSGLTHLDLSENENLMMDDLRWLLRLRSLEYLNLDFIDLHKQNQWLQILTTLSSLSELSLSNCQLGNIIGASLLDYANLTSLKYIDLSGNSFLSELPVWLFNQSDLSYLNLEENRFRGSIPNSIINLRNLKFLMLESNMLSGTIPDWLAQLESLNNLELSWNSFTGSIPVTLGNLSSLTNLDVTSNHLSGRLPENLGQLSNLKVLRVAFNPLSGVVSARNFARLSMLRRLSLASPSFIYDFDPHWTPTFQLEVLHVQYADLNLLPWLYTQSSLSAVTIGNCSFTTVSPNKFWRWVTNLVFLSLFSNNMHWDMSNVLLNSEIVWLVENGLRGGLPRLTSNVRIFRIAHNYLSGSLSPLLCHSMDRETNLQYLEVSFNLLSGGLTNCWVNWTSLQLVDLGNNNITGMIPHTMGTLSNLLFLQVDNNNLYGEIPMSLKDCQKLLILNLGENKFSGSIPSWMGQNVEVVQLRSNEFSGDIPLQICHLSSLIVLDLANNRLSGTIPHCLNNITAMILNNASKSVEVGIINTSSGLTFVFSVSLLTKGIELLYNKLMHVVDLSGNHLSGEIPLQMFRLTTLQSMNLSNNQLTGIIQEEIGNMKQLESLDFSNNTLSGEIPQSMSALSFLAVLNLSFNNLRGQIPLGTQLQSFTSLSYEGNPNLCGTPLIKKCINDKGLNQKKVIEKDELLEGFYMGMGVGFATSFWIVCGSIFFIRKWRHAYFKFLGHMKNQLQIF